MNIAGLSGSINGVKLQRIIQVGISECGRWPSDRDGCIKRVSL